MIAYFDVLMLPACGLFAGIIVWLLNRKAEASDGSLFWGFMIPFACSAMILFDVSKTDTVRKKIDPVYKQQTDLEAHPVYVALKKIPPGDLNNLDQDLMRFAQKGVSIPELMTIARPRFVEIANKRLGWASADAHVAWAQITVDTLIELQKRDPKVCFQALAGTQEGAQALSKGLSASNTQTFQTTFVDLIDSTDRDVHGRAKQNVPNVEFNDAARQWRVVMDAVQARYGEAVSEIVSHKKWREVPPDMQGQVCAARIMQLNTMIEQPVPMAYRLLDSAMR